MEPEDLKWYDLLDQDDIPHKKRLTESHLALLLRSGYRLAPKPQLRTAVPRNILTKGEPVADDEPTEG